jgi:methylglutaconyl-CoA hydratase
MTDAIQTTVDGNGRATVTLNRPDIHNAFDDTLIARLTETFESLGKRDDVRVVVVAANGKSFSAGADLGWMRRMANYSEAENRADAEQLARLIHVLDSLAKPTVARVQGAAIGGGVGLVAACDVAVASDAASFALSEVRLGLIPAVISPYVIGAIGPRQARRYMLTAERFDATEAKRIGLVHAMVPAVELDATVDAVVAALLLGGPEAVRESKMLARDVGGSPNESVRADTARRIARLRASPEGKEGVSSFLEKRKPRWQAL